LSRGGIATQAAPLYQTAYAGESRTEEVEFLEESGQVIANDESGIPDKNLYAAVLKAADSNGDGVLTVAEVEGIKSLSASSKNIQNIQGIQYCKNLK
jgi:hypothetical protein